jgi:hypothetical protein
LKISKEVRGMTHDKVLMSIKVVPNNTAYTFTSPTCTKKEKKNGKKIYTIKKNHIEIVNF